VANYSIFIIIVLGVGQKGGQGLGRGVILQDLHYRISKGCMQWFRVIRTQYEINNIYADHRSLAYCINTISIPTVFHLLAKFILRVHCALGNTKSI